MLIDSVPELRRRVKQFGARWNEVVRTARWLRDAAIESRESADRTRELAWKYYCHWNRRSAGCHSFWRVGFSHVFTALERRGQDYTAIPHYDEIARDVASELSEWEDRCDDLWEFLASPYVPRTTLRHHLDEAVYLILGEDAYHEGDHDPSAVR